MKTCDMILNETNKDRLFFKKSLNIVTHVFKHYNDFIFGEIFETWDILRFFNIYLHNNIL